MLTACPLFGTVKVCETAALVDGSTQVVEVMVTFQPAAGGVGSLAVAACVHAAALATVVSLTVMVPVGHGAMAPIVTPQVGEVTPTAPESPV